MQAFAELLDRLSYTGSTLAKRKLIAEYLRAQPDPQRGLALAALAGTLSFALAKPRIIRELIQNRIDQVLYTLSRDYVGDMAETVALLWEPRHPGENPPLLSEVVEALSGSHRIALQGQLATWLDTLDANGRWALLKLITGALRIGVSSRLAKLALADAFGKEVEEIEQLWHGLAPPYLELFAWLEGRSEKPEARHVAYFMPMMLSHPIEDAEFDALDIGDYQVELKWDGIRVQIVRADEVAAIYSRTGEDISGSFPDLLAAVLEIKEAQFVLDGELLAKEAGEVAPFNSLQRRLNRKAVSAVMLKQYPAHVRLYDILIDDGVDARPLPLRERRARLEAWQARHNSPWMDLSGIILPENKEQLHALRREARDAPRNGVEGLMIKKLASPYLAGRPKGHWYKWKRDTLILDCVLMYAQRGSGKRSSFYSDYTFGVWDGPKLVPVGKAYSGFTDEELVKLDKWIRAHTAERFGPVREVEQGLVLEIEFDSIHASNRHKSGVAMRFPRVHRVRWDKPPAEADTIETARGLVLKLEAAPDAQPAPNIRA